MSDSHLPPGGPPNSEFRDAIVELAKQARDEDLRAEAEVRKRLTKQPFKQFVRVGLGLIVLELLLYGYLSQRRPEAAKAAVHKSLFPETTCNAVLHKTYWKVVAYLRDQGHPPKDFQQMLGKYLEKLPTDPASGKQLLYTTDGEQRFDVRCPESSQGR